MSANPVFVGNIKNAVAQILPADESDLVTLVTPGAAGSRVKSLVCTSDDTDPRVIQLWASVAGTDYLMGEVTIPAGAGSNGVDKAVKVINPQDLPFVQSDAGVNNFLDLGAGTVLKALSKTTVTADKKLQFFAEYGDI